MQDLIRKLNTAVQVFQKQLEPAIRAFIEYDRVAKISETTGWLPYRSFLISDLDRPDSLKLEEICTEVSGFYSDHHLDITSDIFSKLDKHQVDDEAKATLSEALRAHEFGLYRCSCRVLLPEIERIIREDWAGIKEIKTLSHKLLEDGINNEHRTLEDFIIDGPGDLVLFGVVAKQLFAYVNARDQLEGDLILNRHAAAHAWASYSSVQDSLNAIICMDYIFRLTTSFKGKS